MEQKIIKKKYQDLSKYSFYDIIQKLNELKECDLYNYNKIEKYNSLFTCLYEKEEAIEFLFEKIGKDINYLKDRILPSEIRIDTNDISDTEQCILNIEHMKKMKDNFQRFNYIKNNLDETAIEQFKKFSKKFQIIIELDRFYDSSEDYYLDVSNIMGKDFTINIQQDRESFLYINKEGEEKNISMKELISLKNKLHNINENQKEKEKEHLTTPKREDNEMEIKRRNLLFFKKLITNLELIINEYMKTLRNKGSSLDIKITIEVKK
jgi:hypothetical protein